VLVVTGSTRPQRQAPRIAEWVIAVARASNGLQYELVDLADWSLPMDDEPDVPALGTYTQDHTRAWSRKIANADAVIFVTPQYNWGYPAPLKNAIDHLYKEWNGKPVVIVTYGGHGGGKCAAQLRSVVESMKMRPVATMPAITISQEAVLGKPVDPETDFAAYVPSVLQALAELVTQLEATTP
jgi:NAD(P)H-dependent FMN reductase